MKTKINIGLGVILILIILAAVLIKPTPAAQLMKAENLTIVEAPERAESMEHPDFIKEEYIPQLPEGTNVALEGKMDASSFEGSFTPRKAIDGNTMGVSYWEGKKDSYPNLLILNLKEVKAIHAVRICLCPQNIWGKREQTFSVWISSDGEEYTELVPEETYVFDPDRGNEAVMEFDAVETQYVKLSFTNNTGAGGGQVAELEVYADQAVK